MTYPPSPPNPPGAGYGPVTLTSEEKNWALGAHVGVLVAAWVALGFLAPLLVLLVKGKDSAFIRRHAVESLNFQISMLIYLAVSFVLVLVFVGIFLLIGFLILDLVVIIVATIKASNGEDYRYPLCIRFVH